jgi:hypothetical protein
MKRSDTVSKPKKYIEPLGSEVRHLVATVTDREASVGN